MIFICKEFSTVQVKKWKTGSLMIIFTGNFNYFDS